MAYIVKTNTSTRFDYNLLKYLDTLMNISKIMFDCKK